MNQFRSSREILKVLRDQRDENPDLYVPMRTQPARTLLLIGPTRAGKTTIVRTLQDSLYEPDRPTLYSGTRRPEPQEIGGLRIIDMPGFNDLKMQSRDPSLNNKSILNMLQEQLDINDPVHLIAFVFNLADGIKQEDIEIMNSVKRNMPNLSDKMMLIVTHAEESNNEERNKLIEEFFCHPDVKKYNLRSFFKRGILFVGCLRHESLKHRDYTALVNEHQNILEMRKQFIEKCFEDISVSKKQKPISSSWIPRSSYFYIFLVVIIAILAGSYLQFLTNVPREDISGQMHDQTYDDGKKHDAIYSETVANTDDDNSDTRLDETDKQLIPDSTSAIMPLKTTDTIEMLLKNILLEMKELNKASKTQSDALGRIEGYLYNKESESKERKRRA